jgi:GalNAc-alpha-(1->4)-GalNAc-alpha-(1->3)-diNAcBac-PP-undecaprenol alpha-1,4-N-acetyl-D-galactosaminyltransferase
LTSLNTKKHIAFIIYSLDSGGAERVVTTLANHFVKSYNVTIITIINKPSFYALDTTINLKYCVDKVTSSKHIFGALINNLKLMSKIKGHLKNQKIDIALSFMTTSNVLSVLASRALKIPCIISERSNPYIYTHNSFWNKLVKFTYPKANFLVVQSQLIEDYYTQFVKKEQVFILPNPIAEDLSLRKHISEERKKIILNVGRLDSNKAQDLLIKAFANLNANDWKLILVGDGQLLESYKALAEELNISSSIVFTGNVSDISTYYNAASIFAFTSKSEGFPNALVEAMYFELACVSTNCPTGPSEVIDDSKNGYLIEVDNQKQLEARLLKLMNNDALRVSFGKEAYSTAQSFEINNVANQWNNLITKLL